ncbi:MAG: putative NADH-flavin reductase [Porticoccaceae bacterium]|jgi:putative NADH-flavin reductase
MLKIGLAIAFSIGLVACSGGNGTKNGDPLLAYGDDAPTLQPNPEQLDLVIFGGTAGVGLQTAKLALQRGHKVTSISRRPERMTLEHENLNNIKGDFLKLDSYAAIIDGKNAVISAIGVDASNEKITIYSEGMKNILNAIGTNSLTQVVTVTGIGAGDSKGHGGFFYDRIINPFMLEEDYADKTRQEALLRSSQSRWTIVRPGFLTDDASETRYRVLLDMDGVLSGDVPRADVAHFLLAVVEQGAYVNDTVFLSN